MCLTALTNTEHTSAVTALHGRRIIPTFFQAVYIQAVRNHKT
jgi:hypothetical protein